MSTQNELNFLNGVNFDTPGRKKTINGVTEKKDGYIVLANPGLNRKYDRHDISLVQFCIRQGSVPKFVAIGIAGKDVLFVMDSALKEHEAINLYVQPSTKIISSKPKVTQLFEVLGVEQPKGADSYTVINFNLVHMFGNIYKAIFDEPVVTNVPVNSSAPGVKHF